MYMPYVSTQVLACLSVVLQLCCEEYSRSCNLCIIYFCLIGSLKIKALSKSLHIDPFIKLNYNIVLSSC